MSYISVHVRPALPYHGAAAPLCILYQHQLNKGQATDPITHSPYRLLWIVHKKLQLIAAMACRGAGPLERVQGLSEQLLQLLQQRGIADSQDTSIKAAATAVLQQLLRPGIVQQVLVEGVSAKQQQQQTTPGINTAKEADLTDSGNSSSSSNALELEIGWVHVLLQLAACEASGLGTTAAAGCNVAAAQAQAVEQLLGQLAAAAGHCETDELLGYCRVQLLSQVGCLYI